MGILHFEIGSLWKVVLQFFFMYFAVKLTVLNYLNGWLQKSIYHQLKTFTLTVGVSLKIHKLTLKIHVPM